MAERAGTLVIKVEADTEPVERSVKRTRREITKANEETLKLRRSTARWETASNVSSIGSDAVSMYRGGRNAGLFGPGGFKKFAARTILTRLIPAFAAAYIGGRIFRRASGLGGSASARGGSLDPATTYLATIARTALLQQKTIQDAQAGIRAGQDPFARGAAYARQRMAALGTGVTQAEILAAGRLTEAQQELTESRQALGRIRSMVLSDFQTGARRFQTQVNTGLNRGVRGYMGLLGFGNENLEPGRARTAASAMRTFGPPNPFDPTSFLPPMPWGFGRPGAGSFFRRNETELPGEALRRQALFRNLQMQQLRLRGPAQVGAIPPTVQAGTEGAYRFRVQQQRTAMQMQENQRYQQEVLALLRRMVEQGEATEAEVQSQRLRTGETAAQIAGV